MTIIEPQPMPPKARMPGIVPVRRYVGQADDAVVMLLEVRAYSQGCLLEFVVVARGPGGDGASPSFDVDFGERPGVEAERMVCRLDDPVSGSPRLWISPLPPVEGVILVTDWPAHGIVGQRSALDGESIRQAAWDSFPCLPA